MEVLRAKEQATGSTLGTSGSFVPRKRHRRGSWHGFGAGFLAAYHGFLILFHVWKASSPPLDSPYWPVSAASLAHSWPKLLWPKAADPVARIERISRAWRHMQMLLYNS